MLRLTPVSHVAVDLGSSSVRTWHARSRRVTASPWSAVASGRVLDAAACRAQLRAQLRPAHGRRLVATVALPAVGRDAQEGLLAVLRDAGAAATVPVDQPLAAAVGAGLDISDPPSALLVDVGAGLVEVAVVGEGRVLAQDLLRWGAADLAAVVRAQPAGLPPLPLAEAERALRTGRLTVRDARTGTARTSALSASALDALLLPAVEQVRGVALRVLDELPATVAGDVAAAGVVLVGGGAHVIGLAERLSGSLRMPVHRPREPARAVIAGLARMVPQR